MTWYSGIVSSRSGDCQAGWIGVLLAALTSLMHASGAFAAANQLAASYSVPEECSARTAWLAAVRERLPPLLRTHPLLETLSVRIEKLGDAYVGELASTAEATLNSARSLRGASCEEVLDALSFVGALGLERSASGTGDERSRGAALPPSVTQEITGPLSPVEVDEGRVPAQLGGARNVQLGAAGFALLQGGLTPAQSVAFGVALRFAWSTPGWQPWVMLGAYSSLPEEHRLAGGGSVRFEHWSTHAVGCPWRFPEAGRLGVRPCLELDVGRSTGEGLGVPRAAKHAAPWLSGGAQLRAELALGDRLELGASFGAVAPLWHAHFFFLPDSRSFETPDFGFRAGSYASLLF